MGDTKTNDIVIVITTEFYIGFFGVLAQLPADDGHNTRVLRIQSLEVTRAILGIGRT